MCGRHMEGLSCSTEKGKIYFEECENYKVLSFWYIKTLSRMKKKRIGKVLLNVRERNDSLDHHTDKDSNNLDKVTLKTSSKHNPGNEPHISWRSDAVLCGMGGKYDALVGYTARMVSTDGH